MPDPRAGAGDAVRPDASPAEAGPGRILEAAQRLAQGRLVAFPTETVYGLGADAENPEAVAQHEEFHAQHAVIVQMVGQRQGMAARLLGDAGRHGAVDDRQRQDAVPVGVARRRIADGAAAQIARHHH